MQLQCKPPQPRRPLGQLCACGPPHFYVGTHTSVSRAAQEHGAVPACRAGDPHPVPPWEGRGATGKARLIIMGKARDSEPFSIATCAPEQGAGSLWEQLTLVLAGGPATDRSAQPMVRTHYHLDPRAAWCWSHTRGELFHRCQGPAQGRVISAVPSRGFKHSV